MKVFLDDKRVVEMSHNPNKGLGEINDFVILRDDKSFIDFINQNFDKIELISFDHDLACFNNDGEFTGKTACEFVINKCLDTGEKFPDWYVHSDNNVGRENIIGTILNYVKRFDGIDVSDFRYFHKGYVNGKFV